MATPKITDLGFGGRFAIWAMRNIALGSPCPIQLGTGFSEAFCREADVNSRHRGCRHARLALNAMKSFMLQFDVAARRKLTLRPPASWDITPDEISLTASLAAAQSQDTALLHAHLRWLLAGGEQKYVEQAARTYALICKNRDIALTALPAVFTAYPKTQSHTPAFEPRIMLHKAL